MESIVHQILGLREFFKQETGEMIKYDAFFDKEWRAPNLKTMFIYLQNYLDKIPEHERWNLFYTIAKCGEAKREFVSQNVLAWDIDGCDDTRLIDYANIISEILGVGSNFCLIFSGNGLHFLVELDKEIETLKFFKDNKNNYKAICAKINAKLQAAGLSGKADTAIFEPRRILRLPGTINRKPNKPEKLCKILSDLSLFVPVSIDLKKLSGIQEIDKKDTLPSKILKTYPETDSKAVQEKCLFLASCKEKPNTVNEPQWYAALSILARLQDGKNLSHEYSRAHKAYNYAETEAKISQALDCSGPRTCESINNIWSGCEACPHWGIVKSPILIRGDQFIKTQHTGFHTVFYSAKGDAKFIPCPEDLEKFFSQLHCYKNVDNSGITVVFNGKYYEEMGDRWLDAFAQEHYKPCITQRDATEFRNLIQRKDMVKIEWFEQTTCRKINFQNGYLDIEKDEFLPHSREIGFRYVLPYEYDPEAKAPAFEMMLELITQGDSSLADNLLEFSGYALSNDEYWCHKALMLVGEGANGKSTFLNILRHLAGQKNFSAYTILDLERSEYNRHGLDKMLFNLCEETSPKSFNDSSMFKRLIGGAGIAVRPIYGSPYIITNKAKFILTCNELPPNFDTSHGFGRRLLIVPFLHKFSANDPGFDPHIDQKLVREMPGIFNLVYKKYAKFFERKEFTKSESIEKANENYLSENNSVFLWAQNNVYHCEKNDQGMTFSTIRDLFDDYVLYTETYLRVRPLNIKMFGVELRKHIKDFENKYKIIKHEKATKKVIMNTFAELDYGMNI
jgi:putative DNA primase/helicase